MPLVRFQLRNEYSLGQPELYREANREDPKAVLDGVAVAGLVGILRQLGDLAEFAAEVFHGLQEEVITTASRSHKLMVRVQNIEAALPPLEKAVLAQTSHIHFAYTTGTEWHSRIKTEQNHFIYNDLPRFIMDSYEECNDPPRLHLLDKFDTGGPGSCLKRYSDPTFFRRASGNYSEPVAEKVQKDKKARKSKKKRSLQMNGEVRHYGSMSNHSGRMQFTSPVVNGQTFPSHTASTIDMRLKSDLGDNAYSFDSRTESGYAERVFHLGSSVQPAERESNEFSSTFIQHNSIPDIGFTDGQPGDADDSLPCSSSPERVAPSSPCVMWDEKSEIMEPNGQHYDGDEALEVLTTDSGLDTQDRIIANLRIPDPTDVVFDDESALESSSIRNQRELDEVDSELDNYMDALNTIESESENDLECQTKHEVQQFSSSINDEANGVHEFTTIISDCHPSKNESQTASYISSNKGLSGDFESIPSKTVVLEQTSHTSGRSSNSDYSRGIESSTNNISDHHPSKYESHNASGICSGKGMSCELLNSVPLEKLIHEQTPHISGRSSNSNHSPGIEGSTKDISYHNPSKYESHTASNISPNREASCDLPNSDPLESFVHEQISHISGKSSNSECLHSLEASTEHIPDHHSSKYLANTASSISSNEGPSCGLPISVPSKSFAHERTVRISGKSSNSDDSPDIESSPSADTHNGSKAESVASGPSFSTSGISSLQEPQSNKTMTSSCKSQDSQYEVSGVNSTTFWTNGGLLGLQPSKPPDFAAPHTANHGSATRSKDVAVGLPHQTSMPKNDRESRLVNDPTSMERDLISKCPTSLHEDQDVKLEKTCDSYVSNRFNHAYTSAVTGGNLPPLDADGKAMSTEVNQGNDDSSPQMFGLGHKLLLNGFHRTTSLLPDGKSELASSLKSGVLEQNVHHGIADQASLEKAFGEKFGRKSGIDSLTSSPPLEHMKISFHPINGFEASKLKLTFPDGGHCNESIRDMFPSFQLVPESAIPWHEAGSDSDDDTFCRSSPYMSDDYIGHHSASDSEQWESGESPQNKDHELYDVLHRVSESVSSSLQLGETGNHGIQIDTGFKCVYNENGADPDLSAALLDLPSFDAVNPVVQVETNDNLKARNILESQHPRVSTSAPSPPPLPPVQWRSKTAHYDMAVDKQDILSAHGHAFDLKLPGSAVSQQPMPAPATEQQITEDAIIFKLKSKQQEDQQKLKRQKDVNQHANDTGMDEKEDFLHQIRTKSFTLRRTITTKPNFGSGPTANDKVTAILEKANAIRQAVGSDDGEETDNWSDT